MAAEMVIYKGRSRRGAGLVKGETYQVLDRTWKSMIKIRTGTGAETFCPCHNFIMERPAFVPGLRFHPLGLVRPKRLQTTMEDGKKITEVRVPGLHLVIVRTPISKRK